MFVMRLNLVILCILYAMTAQAEMVSLQLRSLSTRDGILPQRQTQEATWDLAKTAVIVCDTWDYHHCLNAVRRLEEFAPRLNQVLAKAREKGAIIIHAPSDCMPAYEQHPARRRAQNAPAAQPLPKDITQWCSRITAEANAVYPIDQSDGGEDDDPAEHAAWAEKLRSLGRNPSMPWKKQSDLITIDSERDYISDRGDEVWNILQQRGIQNVILTGVHTNMCVLGRPFGLRQMVKNGKTAVLMRDMTDCMYNPQRWPYVDHFSGNDLVIAYVERHICPTITSDQFLGSNPFHSKYDQRAKSDILTSPPLTLEHRTFEKQWNRAALPSDWKNATRGVMSEHTGPAWLRCAVCVPANWLPKDGLTLELGKGEAETQAWLNGQSLERVRNEDAVQRFQIPAAAVLQNEANLLVLRIVAKGSHLILMPPKVMGQGSTLELKGTWQLRIGDDASWSNIPLPAKFGAAPEMVFEP